MKLFYFLLLSFVILSGCAERKVSGQTNETITTNTQINPRPASGPIVTIASNKAVEVIKSYYKAINEKNFEEAYNYWEGNGKASKQSFDDFKKSLSTITSSTIRVDSGRVEGAAGSVYIELPVKLKANLSDGTTQYFKGSYTLKKSMTDGASASQKQWHIYSANLTEVKGS